jgi:hypothetical protein
MKTNNSRTLLTMLSAALFFTMLSFSPKPGGDSFTIHLNDKLLFETYVYKKETTKTISLTTASDADVLKIHYSHCGKMGIGRKLALVDSRNREIKTWKFEDSSDGHKGAMTITVGEINRAQKNATDKSLSLVYSAQQLEEGITLTNLTSRETRASLN